MIFKKREYCPFQVQYVRCDLFPGKCQCHHCAVSLFSLSSTWSFDQSSAPTIKCVYQHSDNLTTHALICVWLCRHAWRTLNGCLLCLCTGCNAWEMVNGVGGMATHRHQERKAPFWKWLLLWRRVHQAFVMYTPSHWRPTGYWFNRNGTQKPIIATWCCELSSQILKLSVDAELKYKMFLVHTN